MVGDMLRVEEEGEEEGGPQVVGKVGKPYLPISSWTS